MAYYVTFQKENSEPKLGVALRDKNIIVDLPEAYQQLSSQGRITEHQAIPNTMVELIQSCSKTKSVIQTIIEEVQKEDALRINEITYISYEEDVKLLAPIPRPSKNVFAVGLNYKKHSKEFNGNDYVTQFPILFSKAPTSVIGPEETIESYPQYTDSVDYEAELAVVIGKKGRDIPKEQVQDYIFGYTIINDISVRDRQKRTSQWFIGKSMDTHCPMGPYLVERSDIEWPAELELICRVNGEERQHSNTRLLLFDIPEIISTLSEGITLEPGDIIATGTCEGVGLGFDPPRFLKKGDIVEVEIEKLGVLRNTVR